MLRSKAWKVSNCAVSHPFQAVLIATIESRKTVRLRRLSTRLNNPGAIRDPRIADLSLV